MKVYLASLYKSAYPQANLRGWFKTRREADKYVQARMKTGEFVRSTVREVKGTFYKGNFYPSEQRMER